MKSTLVVSALAASAAAYQPVERRQAEATNVTTTTVLATNATAVANATAPVSVNGSYVQSVLETALPSSLLAIAITNPAAASSIIASELGANMTPTWFAALPTAVQTYLLGPSTSTSNSTAGGNITGTLNGTGIYNSTTGLNNTVPGNGTAVILTATNSAGATVLSTRAATAASSTGVAAIVTSRAGAAMPTAVMGAGLAGLVGLVGMIAL